MSSYYASEQLTRKIIKAILVTLKIQSRVASNELPNYVQRNLSKKDEVLLKEKGGSTEVSRILKYMINRKYVTRESAARDSEITLTSQGLERLEKITFKPLTLNKKWDGKWRILTFDIPEDSRAARDAIRRLIKELGFLQLHLSVWVHPLPCEEYIRVIQEAYGVKKHLTLLTVDTFDQEEDFKKKFQKVIN